MVAYALPGFAVGMVLVWIFAVQLAWLPAGGFSDPLLAADAPTIDIIRDRLARLALPLLTMVIATLAVPIRQQHAAVTATSAQPWVQAARARGVAPALVAWRHCWRPALTPIVTLFGLWLPLLVSGAVFVESVFAWPGVGSLIAQATFTRDVPLVIGAGLMLVALVQLGSFVADLLYRVVDPAQRTS
jgi:peptide/nickel transport system permease protein